jgi:hypothetical protein
MSLDSEGGFHPEGGEDPPEIWLCGKVSEELEQMGDRPVLMLSEREALWHNESCGGFHFTTPEDTFATISTLVFALVRLPASPHPQSSILNPPSSILNFSPPPR